jgi:pimeloyl-ACP methyl ester carboxylesterase
LHEKAAKIADTPLGKIEYSIKGEAPYLLAIHGTPGMHDGYVGYFDNWYESGFGVICPSRPGYGRTPKVASFE